MPNAGSPSNDLTLYTMANCSRQHPLAALNSAFNDTPPGDAHPISFLRF